MPNCLSPAEIKAFLADALPPTKKARAQVHLKACAKCRRAVDPGRSNDEFEERVKNAYKPGTNPASPAPVVGRSSRRSHVPTIHGYEVQSEIHRGGQGVVYRAVQKATKRTVALKVMLEGPYASESQRRRFEREVELVARLRHPNIVTVFDSGVTEDALHYFAMDYIHGAPLNDFVAMTRLSLKASLALFRHICHAVSYANQHGVIHRDLKPGNICIDTDGKPFVLDFGLAKVAGSNTLGGERLTQPGHFMGTLAYASPEQVKGDSECIDVRTDVYALGVILYEMLTGTLPYDVTGPLPQVFQNIAETEPRRPSTVCGHVDDEVETIILRALAKQKERRYQSVESLAQDVGHYLKSEPIDAKRDSRSYMLRKALQRYRIPVAIGVTMVFLLATLAVVMAIQSNRLAQQRNRAMAAEEKVSSLMELMEISEIDSLSEKSVASAAVSTGRVYEAAAGHLRDGEFDKAIRMFNKVLALDSQYVLAYANRGLAYYRTEEFSKAAADAAKALRIDPNLAGASVLLRGANERLKERQQASQGSTKEQYRLAGSYFRKGNYHQAIAHFNNVIQMDPQHALAFANRGYSYYRLKDYNRALTDLQQAGRLNPEIPNIDRLIAQVQARVDQDTGRR